MALLADAALSEDERRLVDRIVAELRERLGQGLRALWLYGSRARGEQRGPDSDIDLLAIVEDAVRVDAGELWELPERLREELGIDWVPVSLLVHPIGWLAERRAIDAFYIREVDRDKIVLAGDGLDEVGRPPGGAAAAGGLVEGDGDRGRKPEGGLSPRSQEYLAQAREQLAAARLSLEGGLANPAISSAYMAMLNAARAALSEEDLFTRSHRGTWHLFGQAFVVGGRFDAELRSRAAAAQEDREHADYGHRLLPLAKARELVALAEAFLAEVERMLAD